MKLNNKGFAITGILYGLLLLFVLLVGSYLTVLSSKKNRLDSVIENAENEYFNRTNSGSDEHTVKVSYNNAVIATITGKENTVVREEIGLTSSGCPTFYINCDKNQNIYIGYADCDFVDLTIEDLSEDTNCTITES